MAMLPISASTALANWVDDAVDFSFKEGDLYYKIVSESGKTCKLVGHSQNNMGTWFGLTVVIPETVNGYTIVEVDDEAFTNNLSVVSITFPRTIKRIGKKVCTYDSKLREIIIQGCDTIDDFAFMRIDNLEVLQIDEGTKWIGDLAFSSQSTSEKPIESISIPNSVEHLGKAVFELCYVERISLPSHIKKIPDEMFAYCRSLKHIDNFHWEEVDTIGALAFRECNNLESNINITNAVSVGANAFENCYKANITFDCEKLKDIKREAFTNCYNLSSPIHITADMPATYYWFPFNGCTNVSSIIVDEGHGLYAASNGCNAVISKDGKTLILGCASTIIPDGVETISSGVTDYGFGKGGFAQCKGLKAINLPSSVKEISNYSFQGCDGLTEVTIPETVEDLGEGVFNDCANLEKVHVNSPTAGKHLYSSISRRWFGNCPKLASIVITNNNPFIDSRNNCNAVIATEMNRLLEGCKTTVMPKGITSIADNAFQGALLASAIVPEGVETIGDHAFADMEELTSIELPSTVTALGLEVFVNCPKLTTMTCRSETPPSFVDTYSKGLFGAIFYDQWHFTQMAIDTLFVRKGCIGNYIRHSNWKKLFNNFLVEDDGTGEFLAGDVFTAKTVEGVGVRYCVMDAEAKTVAAGGYGLPAIGDFGIMPEGFKGTVTLPDVVNGYRVTAISDKAFQGKKFLRFINMPVGLDSIGVEAFQGSVLHEIHFPSTLTKLGRRAFADCQNMSGVPVIPDGVKDIPDECFANCTSLWSPSLPHTLERIGRRAFWNIMGGHMFFPATLKSVGEEAYFGFMDGYATIQYRSAAMQPVEIPENAIAWMITPEQLKEFWMQDQAPGLYVPKGSLEAYKTTKGWSKFWPGIYELDNIDKCTLTYVLNGKECQQVTVEYGREYEPDLVPDVPQGYKFSGWTWDTGETGALLVRQDHKVSGIFTTEESQQMVKTLNLYGSDGEPCGTMDVNFLLTTDDNNHNSAIVYKPRDYVDLAEVMTEGIPAFSNVTGTAGVLVLPDVIEDKAGVVYTVDSIGSCAFYGCSELLGIDFGNSVQAIGTQAFQRSALQGMLTIPANIHRIGMQAFTNTKGVTRVVFLHSQPSEIWWGVGNKDDFAGPQQTVLEVCQGIIDECASMVRGDNFMYWYAENNQSLMNSFGGHIPNQLKLNGKVVTAANCSDILGNGKARYNARTRTLTLMGCEAEELFTTLIDGLTVMLVGENQLQSISAYRSTLTVTSDEVSEGRLTVQGSVKLDRSDMTVKDCQRVEVNDEEDGLYAPWHNDWEARLTVDNSVLYVGKLRGFTNLHLVNVSLPQNVIFAAATGTWEHDSGAMANLFQVWRNQVYELGSATIQYYEPPVQDEVGVTIQTDFATLFGGEGADKTPYNNEYDGVLYHLYREVKKEDVLWWDYTPNPVVNYYKDGALYLTTQMTDEQMETIAAADNLNTDEFRTYNGLVVHVSQGSGIISIDCATRPGHVLKVKVGAQEPVAIQTDGRQKIVVPYQTKQDCYIYIYVANAYNIIAENRRLSATRRSAVDFPGETVAQLFGLSLTVESVSGVKSVTIDAADGASRWYDLQGRRIIKPMKEGLYIRNGRKVMVK